MSTAEHANDTSDTGPLGYHHGAGSALQAADRAILDLHTTNEEVETKI